MSAPGFAVPKGDVGRIEVPRGDTAWCQALQRRLSVCCSAPSLHRVAEVRAIIESPPAEMLPNAWDDLVQAALAWLATDAGKGEPFKGMRLIEAAIADMPVPVPAWADRYQ